MVSPERTYQVLRLFLPLAVGLIFLIWGIVDYNPALATLGAGALGLPGLGSTLTKTTTVSMGETNGSSPVESV